MSAATLERWYRRMLAWFPAEHRRVYGEEMVGVLLASASEGRSRPAPVEVIDLAVGGLRTRLRTWFRATHIDPVWRDALSAFSITAPALMFLYVSFHLYNVLRLDRIFALHRIYALHRNYAPQIATERTILLVMEAAIVTMLAALAICPALTRRQHRHSAIFIASIPAILGAVATIYLDISAPQFNDVAFGFTVFFVTEIIAVIISPDPRRGWQVLTRKSLIALALMAALAAVGQWTLQASALASAQINRSAIEFALVAVGIALILIFGSDAVKRLLALLAIPGYPLLAYVQLYSVLFAPTDSNVFVQALYLPTLVIAMLVVLAVWRSSRRDELPGAAPG